jgi:hypothetical protein
MIHFSVGDQVVIRFGLQQGQKATIIKNPRADAYKVKVEDGSIRFYSWKGLIKEQERGQQSV